MTHTQPPLPEPPPDTRSEGADPNPLANPDARRLATGAKRVFTARTPLWVTLVLVAAVGLGFGYVWATRETTELGPAVRDARRVQVDLLICNETVDARDINPRQAEKNLQSLFEQQQGVASATVRIEREDCGTTTTTTSPTK